MRNSVESLLGESYSLNKLHYKKAARVMHCKLLFIRVGTWNTSSKFHRALGTWRNKFEVLISEGVSEGYQYKVHHVLK